MARERSDPNEFLRPHFVQPDGLPARKADVWARQKLGILASYLRAFTTASKNRAAATYFVDGLAGPGRYYFEDASDQLHGSSLIALNTQPPFTKCIAMDISNDNIEVLRLRTSMFGGRCAVHRGDVNVDLLPIMQREISNRYSPIFVFLDPEGYEVDWATVENISKFRLGELKAEILILANTSDMPRVIGRYDPRAITTRLGWSAPPGPEWLDVQQEYLYGHLKPEEARTAWARIYSQGLRKLGYEHAIARAVPRSGRAGGASRYHLIFATDHAKGYRIMRDVFEQMYPDDPARPFPGFFDP